jgi:hypothetical protein
MGSLRSIHTVAVAELKKRFSLDMVALKYPFPQRPTRLLGLVKVDGEVFSSERFARVVMMRTHLSFLRTVYSIFVRPRIEFDLPVLSSESVIGGKKTMFLVDVHRAGGGERPGDAEFFDKLIKIRGQYPHLLRGATTLKGKIQSVFSRALCLVNIAEEEHSYALNLFREYFAVYLEMVERASPLSGDALTRAQQAYDEYLKTIVEHDPGVRVYKMLFGKKGGEARALDIFFNLS